MCRGLKDAKSNSRRHFGVPIHLFRHFCCSMYRFVSFSHNIYLLYSLTVSIGLQKDKNTNNEKSQRDRRTDGQTDEVSCQEPITLRAAVRSAKVVVR